MKRIIVAIVLVFTLSGCQLVIDPVPSGPTAPVTTCGNSSTLTGPSSPPTGAVTVPAGNNASLTLDTPSTTYWFAPGTHTIGTGEYDQIDTGQGDTYIGGPGAIILGQGDNNSAFVAPLTSSPSDVTIEYLTIEDFTPTGSQGAVNVNGGIGWVIEHNTIAYNSPGSALMIGSDDNVSSNCLTENGEYGFNAYSTYDTSALTGGVQNVTLAYNEISYNDTCNWELSSPNPVPSGDTPANCSGAGQFNGCGCSGGGKFWETDGATVFDNYVHNNYNVGIWADTDNTGFDVTGNYVADNYGEGIMIEISYNFSITDNTLIGNAVGEGPTNSGFPTGAIYISESGGDSRVPGGYSGVAVIADNQFIDNWSGVVIWENPNRYCSDGSDSVCTLVDPNVFTVASCGANIATAASGTDTGSPPADYYDGCRWKSQNVQVTDNTFDLTQSHMVGCELGTNSCGENGIFSQYGQAPYTNQAIPTAVTFNQNNQFSDNTYSGPWSFDAWSLGNLDNPLPFSKWTAPTTDKCGTSGEISSGTCNSGFGQDTGSTI